MSNHILTEEEEGPKRMRVMDDIWCLCITENIDDYKTGGESPYSDLKYYTSKKKAVDALYCFLKKRLMNVRERQKGHVPVLDISTLDDEGFEQVYDEFAKGEFIPYKWTYEISIVKIEE